jgi:hypothetical protein
MRGLSASLALSLFLAAPSMAAEAEASRRAALELYSLRLIQTGMKLQAYPEEAVRRELEGGTA